MGKKDGAVTIEEKPGNGIRVLSLFSGAGGLDLGFHEAGFDIVFSSDIIPLYCKTLVTNKGRHVSKKAEIVAADVRALKNSKLPSDIDFVIGGPPCQSFSAFGRRAGGAAGRLDERGNLFEAFCDIIVRLSPKGFLFENVRGILGTNKGKDWENIQEAFKAIGYKISYRLLDACDYGAPQHRERIFMVGHKLKNEFLFPTPIYGPDSIIGMPHVPVGHALNSVKHDESLKDLALHEGKYAHLLKDVPPGDNYLYFTAKRGHPHPIFAYRSRFSDFLYKADPSKPIKTIIARPGKYSGPFHWDNREFSIAEYKRLQGFPDDYAFCGNRSEVIMQIGNSVSPKIAKCLAIAVAKQIFKRECEISLLPKSAELSFDKRKSIKAKNTRQLHTGIKENAVEEVRPYFHRLSSDRSAYAFAVQPNDSGRENAIFKVQNDGHKIDLIVGKKNQKKLASVSLSFYDQEPKGETAAKAVLCAQIHGNSPVAAIQQFWNAVDRLVIEGTSLHSLYELYGHFTEPHPIFKVDSFVLHDADPILKFAQHISNFNNCSRYFERSHLLDIFGNSFHAHDFISLAEIIRSYRFDIRCKEINIAIPSDKYMVAYPFCLPGRKQMNFFI